MRSHKNQRGFTLIELMIVVAIIGIIAAIAYPSYSEHVQKTKRSDGQGALMGLAAAMERHYASNNSYAGAGSDGDTGSPTIYADEAPLDGNDKYYDLTIQAADASSFTLRAAPKGGQAGDGMLELDSTGVRRWDEDDSKAFETGEDTWSK